MDSTTLATISTALVDGCSSVVTQALTTISGVMSPGFIIFGAGILVTLGLRFFSKVTKKA